MVNKYKSLAEWRVANPKNYMCAYNNGWVDRLCVDMGWKRQELVKRGHWTKENCINESNKYNSPSEWKRESKGSYNAAQRNGWLSEINKK